MNTFDEILNEIGCRDLKGRRLDFTPIECPHCLANLKSKVCDHRGRAILSIGGHCSVMRFVIAGQELFACFERTECPYCSGAFFHRFVLQLGCTECEQYVRIGMMTFDSNYISGYSSHSSCQYSFTKNSGICVEIPIREFS